MNKMIKRIFISSLLALSCILNANAEQKEKVVTNRWSFITGNAITANHYLTNHEYTGSLIGLQGEHGSFYKKSDNLSWDLDISFITAPIVKMFDNHGLANPSGTTFYGLYQFNTEYGTYYNWNPAKNLFIKAGGVFDALLGVGVSNPSSINNIADIDIQTQIKAAAGIKYGWNFESWGLFLHTELAVPFMGFATRGNKFENALENMIKDSLLPGSMNPMHFTSFHNFQGFNYDFGIDFVLKNLTLFLEYEINNRWWTSYDVQNYRKYTLTRIGISVDLVSRSRHNSTNRQF